MFSGDMFNAGSILTYHMVEEEEAWKNLAAAAFSVANTTAVTTTIKNTAIL
jgi:hypothetical protein